MINENIRMVLNIVPVPFMLNVIPVCFCTYDMLANHNYSVDVAVMLTCFCITWTLMSHLRMKSAWRRCRNVIVPTLGKGEEIAIQTIRLLMLVILIAGSMALGRCHASYWLFVESVLGVLLTIGARKRLLTRRITDTVIEKEFNLKHD